jgi:hypothetical protein
METRYQVFVSSTFVDLIEERQAVMQALLSLNLFPAGMELFPASDDDQWTLIKGVIDDSDYYIIVIGGRYGSLSPEGISYTEKEFDYAVESNVPILAFLHEAPEELPVKKTDQSDEARAKLARLREKVQTGRHVKFWKNAHDLKAQVILSVSAETKRNPRVGWVRANASSDPARLNALNEEIERLRSELAKARTSPPVGSEVYSQGDDTYKITYSIKKTWGEKEYLEVELTWDEIFYEVGPLIMDEAAEHVIRKRLSEELWKYDDNVKTEPLTSKIENDSFETIKIQLIALGYMRKSERKHPPSDRGVYWSITPYGEEYLMRLRAIRRE